MKPECPKCRSAPVGLDKMFQARPGEGILRVAFETVCEKLGHRLVVMPVGGQLHVYTYAKDGWGDF